MPYLPYTIPAPAEGVMRGLSDQQLADGVRAIDAIKPTDKTPEHAQSRIWLLNEFENRHPEIHEQVTACFDDDAPDEDREYIDILVSFVPGVN